MACTAPRREQIAALASGRIDPGEAAELLTHIEGCMACSAEFDLVAALMSASPTVQPRRGSMRTGLLLAAAAMVLATLSIWQPWASGRPSLHELARITPVQAPEVSVRGNSSRGAEYERAIDAYRSGDFAGAARELERVAARAPDDALVNLYLGIARLQLGEPATALPPLRVAAEHGEGLVAERGLWFLANAQLLLDAAEPAREALQRLCDLSGDYAVNAADLLAALRGR